MLFFLVLFDLTFVSWFILYFYKTLMFICFSIFF